MDHIEQVQEQSQTQHKTGPGVFISLIIVIGILWAVSGGPKSLPGQNPQSPASNINASKTLNRISQLDSTQYANQEEFNTWSPSGCSAASMTEVINAYGHTYRITDILQVERSAHAISSQEGLLYGIDSITATVKQFGFTTSSMEGASLDSIIKTANEGTPVIVSFPPQRWQGGHILVVRGGDDQSIWLADSSQYNFQHISRTKFLKYWASWAVLVTPVAQASAVNDLTIVGGPTISAAMIDLVLQRVGSPASGKGQYLYDDGVKYNIDPASALGFFLAESTGGTKGEATATLALGNERCIPDRPCIDKDRGGYAQFYSWEDGFDHWYQMMADGYVKGSINKIIGRQACPCTTVAQIIPIYAPTADHNNEQNYINTVCSMVSLWRAGKIA